MTESTLPPEPAKDASADEIEADIAATRQQLGETIDALEDKLNVSAQAKRKVDQTKTQITDQVTGTVTQVTNRVAAVKGQVTEKVDQARTQVADKVAQTRAKVSGGGGKEDVPTVVVTEAGAQPVDTGTPNRVKHITTRLASKVTQVRARTQPADGAVPTVVEVGGADTEAASAAGPSTGAVRARSNFALPTSQVSAFLQKIPGGARGRGAALAATALTGLVWLVRMRGGSASEMQVETVSAAELREAQRDLD